MTSDWQWQMLSEVLIAQRNNKPLQQGWSPRCQPHPASLGTWGVLKTTAIQAGRFDPAHNKQLPDALDPRPHLEVQVGDLLMTCAGPRARCGVPTLVRHTPDRLMMSGKMYRFRPYEGLDSRFLELWLLSPVAQKRIDAMKTGISDSGLNLTHDRFLRLPVPVPPLDEQRRIIEILEDHLLRLDAAESYIQATARRAATWHASVISRAIWSANHPTARVGSLLREPMRNGRSDRARQGTETGTKTLTLTAVTKNSFSDENTKLTITSSERAAGLWLEPGDVFVQRSNTPQLVGTTARYEGPREWAIFPDLLIRLRVDDRQINSRFLTAALQSEEGHNQLRRKAKGLAGTMPKIDQAAIAGVEVPLPQLEEQTLALQSIDCATEALEGLCRELEVALGRSATLRQSLLASAFTGRLTSGTQAKIQEATG